MENKNITKKYRPKKFSEVIGQKRAVITLTSALEKKVISPAYLFWGIQGAGKTTLARLVAMSLNCEKKIGIEPCGECTECKAILNGCSDYLIEKDGASKSGVDDTRELNEIIRFKVPNNKYKVVIIDECHALSKAAWQAALKTVEEPPPRVLFIFCTTESLKVPATIKSRAVPCQFSGVDDNIISDVLKKICTEEQVSFDDDALNLIAKYAFGSIRDAQTILEGYIRSGKVSKQDVEDAYRTIDPSTIVTYFNNIIDKNIKGASNMVIGWIKLGISPEIIINCLLEYLRNMLMDFNVSDNAYKTLLHSQRERIGDANVVKWVTFFYDQLRFIKEYPMEYTLAMDLITIRLMATLDNFESVKVKKEKKEEKEVKEKKTEEKKDTGPKLNGSLVESLKNACGGTLKKVDLNNKYVTIQTKNGGLFDVVVDPSLSTTGYYLLDTDLLSAITFYTNKDMDSFSELMHKKD